MTIEPHLLYFRTRKYPVQYVITPPGARTSPQCQAPGTRVPVGRYGGTSDYAIIHGLLICHVAYCTSLRLRTTRLTKNRRSQQTIAGANFESLATSLSLCTVICEFMTFYGEVARFSRFSCQPGAYEYFRTSTSRILQAYFRTGGHGGVLEWPIQE